MDHLTLGIEIKKPLPIVLACLCEKVATWFEKACGKILLLYIMSSAHCNHSHPPSRRAPNSTPRVDLPPTEAMKPLSHSPLSFLYESITFSSLLSVINIKFYNSRFWLHPFNLYHLCLVYISVHGISYHILWNLLLVLELDVLLMMLPVLSSES